MIPFATTACIEPCVRPAPQFTTLHQLEARTRAALQNLERGRGDQSVAARDLQTSVLTILAKPQWRGPALRALPRDDRKAVKTFVEASAAFRRIKAASSLPHWRIVAPPNATTLRVALVKAARPTSVGWQLLATVMFVETRMGRIEGTSTAGAVGPFQFLPETWETYGRGDIHSYRDAARAAARLLDANGAPEDLKRALSAYNPDPNYVRGVRLYRAAIKNYAWGYHALWAWRVTEPIGTDVVELLEGYNNS